MTSPLAIRKRADDAYQAKSLLQYRLAVVIAMATFMVLFMLAIGVGFAKMDRYDRQNQEVSTWTLE